MMNSTNASQAYHAVGVQSGVESADPHQLVTMLLNGAMSRISTARGHMQRGDIAEQGECISRAISIVDGLRVSLNYEMENDIVASLEALYEYISRRLLQANVDKDETILEEVTSLLDEIRSAWDAIPAEDRAKAQNGA